MSKILGLDLGTNSIGWAVVDDEKEGNKLQDKGVLIFTEGVKKEKGQEKSRAAERTGFRSARRLNFRRKIRKYQTLLVLAKYNMCPLDVEKVKEWRKSNFKRYPIEPEFLNWLKTDESLNKNPYYFRDIASREKINNLDLGRALYHIAQRRGFLSNRLDQSDDNLIKSKKDDIQELINKDCISTIELTNGIEVLFESYEFKDKKKKDCANATETKLWSIRKYIINVIQNKIKEKDYSKIEDIKEEIKRYINKPENLGAVEGNISELNKAIEYAKCKTLGQYFWKLYKEDRNDSNNKIRNNYTSREEHYLAEFEIICKAQGLENINDSKKNANERYSGIVKELYKAIFYQRPLKSQKGLIGKCSLEPNRTRCSVSRPEFEEFRMYSFMNNIKIKAPNNEKFRFLTKEEKIKIEPKFYRKTKPTFTFEDIKNILGKEYFYNYKDKSTVSGCPTIANFINVFGNNWSKRIFENYTDRTIKNRKTNEVIRIKTKEEMIADIWHILSTYISDEKLKDFAINKLKLTDKFAEKFSKIHLKKDYANLSLYAINKILPYLKTGLLYSHAVFMANMDMLVISEKWNDEKDRAFIETGIGNIIDKHQEENKVLYAINSLLKKCFNNNFNYSKEAEDSYRTDLEKILKKEFGTKSWSYKPNRNKILSDAFENFIKYLKERKHVKIKRIDEKTIDFLKGKNETGEIFCEDENLFKKLYHPSDIEKFKPIKIKDKNDNEYIGLGSPEVGSIKNPMAMRALYQLKKIINTLIIEGQIGENTKINIELSRQLNDANKRKAIEKWQNDRKELYQEYKKKIKELYRKETGNELKEVTNSDIEKFAYALEQREDGKIVSKEDILKYSLWKEQNHICIYTGNTINLSSFLGANPTFDIEHTLPRSRSWDNSQMNKTLCENKFNRDIKKDFIPSELPDNKYNEILPRIKHWKEKYEALNTEIEKLKRQTRNATEKEQKDRLIQKRHYLKMEHDYWKGKYQRFTMEEIKEGFKNSQAVDIGIISKYARAYLKSVFKKVYSIKGEMTAEYRKAWGLHDTFKDKWGRTQYEPKDRSNHIHHCIDAVTIASMNKYKYDKLAHAWGLEDKGDYNTAKKELENEKPWKTFTEDVRNFKNEVFIVHQNRDILPIQTKKFERKRGKIQYVLEYEKDNNGNYIRDEKGKKIPQKDKKEKLIYKLDENGKRIPKIQQGDTVRGPLHKENYIGIVERSNELNTKSRAFIEKIIEDETKRFFYVKRSPITKDFSESDVNKIVDEGIKMRIKKNGLKNVKTEDGFILLPAEKKGENGNEKDLKKTLIKKIRLFEKDTPIEIKNQNEINLQSLKAKRKIHKHYFYAQNKENYCMAIYEGKDDKGKLKRDYELVNNIDAGEYFKMSNKRDRVNNISALVPEKHLESNYSLLKVNNKPFILRKGTSVLLLKDRDESASWGYRSWLKSRLYIISGIDKDGIKLNHHQEARMGTDIIKFMNDIINRQKFEIFLEDLSKIENINLNQLKSEIENPEINKKDFFNKVEGLLNDYYKGKNILNEKGEVKKIKLKNSSLTTPKGGDVIDNYKSFPYVKFKPNGFLAKLEGIDFKITQLGKIIKIKK